MDGSNLNTNFFVTYRKYEIYYEEKKSKRKRKKELSLTQRENGWSKTFNPPTYPFRKPHAKQSCAFHE